MPRLQKGTGGLPRSLLRRRTARQNKKENRNGSGRRFFPRKMNLSPRLVMENPTILSVHIILSSGSATPQMNAARTLQTMKSQSSQAKVPPAPSNISRLHGLLLPPVLLKRGTTILIVKTLEGTERSAREDYSLY
jgi:hypothetical protein